MIRGEFLPQRAGNVWSREEKEILSTVHRGSVFSAPLRLVSRPVPRPAVPLWCGPRWGLNPKTADAEKFANAPLRLATWQTKKHKEKMRKFEG
jgi:hypothetical protein